MNDYLDELIRIDFIKDIELTLDDFAGQTAVRDLIPKIKALMPGNREETDKRWLDLVAKILSDARTMPLDELETVIRKISSGYVRGELRTIWKNRTTQ